MVYIVNEPDTITEDQALPNELLIKNTISAFEGGYLGEEQALFVLDFAAKLCDSQAQGLLAKSKETSVLEAFNSIDK